MELNINKPLVSIIMNCYNSSLYLKEALDSVLNQTYNNWEIIFWDNQSSDKSAIIFKEYVDSRFKYFYAPTHTNLGEARKLAVQNSKGSWIAFLDCDDYWLLTKLAQHICDEDAVEQQGTVGSICRLILHQFRWLHARAHQLDLIPKILNLIQAFPLSLKRDAIAILPDIAEDSDHKTIVVALQYIMTDDTSCTIPILDALSILNVPSDLCHEMTTHVVATLASAHPEDLPVIIKFLMQTCDLDKSDRVISAMREQLSFMDAPSESGADDSTTLLIGALAAGLRLRPEFAS